MKKLMIFIIAVLVLAAAGIAGLKVTGNWGRLVLMDHLNNLQNKEYTFSADVTTGRLDGLDLYGTVTEGNITAAVSINNTDIAAVYHSSEGETVYDIMPLVNSIVSEVQSSLPFEVSITSLLPEQVTVSQSQLNTLTGNTDTTDYFSMLYSIEPWQAALGVKSYSDISESEALLGTDGISYYRFSSDDVELVIGVPDSFSDQRLAIRAVSENLTLEAVLSYEEADVEEFVMPEVTVTDDTISILSQLYGYWQQIGGIAS